MTPSLELVKSDGRDRVRASGPSWSSIGVFLACFFAVLSLGCMVGLGWLTISLSDDVKVLQLKVQKLDKELAIQLDRTQRLAPDETAASTEP